MKLLTAKKGETHFTSMHFRAMLEAICGTNSYNANLYELLEPELAANNVIKIRSGLLTHHGGLFLIEPGTYDEVSYINGTQGMKRIDLVVARYTKDTETGIENGEWIVIQGTPAESDPVAPEYTVGNMQNGDLIDDCPVFELRFDGINVVEVKKLLKVAKNIDELESEITELNGKTIKIYSGVNASVNTGNNVWSTHRVVFPEPFTNVPFINVMEHQTASGQAASENIAIRAHSITTTGFEYYVHTPATGFEYGTYWEAIGY